MKEFIKLETGNVITRINAFKSAPFYFSYLYSNVLFDDATESKLL